MSLYSVIFFLGCLMYATAIPEPEPKYHSTKIDQQPLKPNPFKSSQPTFNPRKDYGRPARARRFVDNFQTNFNNHNNGQQPRSDWELRADTARDKFGQTTGQLSLDRHGKNFDVGVEWKQNLGDTLRHGDRTWVGINGKIRF